MAAVRYAALAIGYNLGATNVALLPLWRHPEVWAACPQKKIQHSKFQIPIYLRNFADADRLAEAPVKG